MVMPMKYVNGTMIPRRCQFDNYAVLTSVMQCCELHGVVPLDKCVDALMAEVLGDPALRQTVFKARGYARRRVR